MLVPSASAPCVDEAAECIWRDGKKISVRPKAFLVLRRLMERRGQLVTKEELLDAVWPGTYVSDTVLNNAIVQLRQALGDDPKQPRYIETVHRRGFRWIGATPAAAEATPLTPSELEDDSPAFVGRAESLAALEQCYARAASGRRQFVFVTGEPGIGKTALVDQFLRHLETSSRNAPTQNLPPPFLLARGQCIEACGADQVYRSLREAVEQLLREGGPEMGAAFRSLAPTWLLQMPELLAPEEVDALRRTVTASTSERMQRELERAIEAASAQRVLVLVLEDLHWSDDATVSLLWALAARRAAARLLIIGTYRPVDAVAQQHPIVRLKHELVGKRQCSELVLEGLASHAISTYLDRRFLHHQLPAGLALRLSEQTSGNPLFLLNALDDFEQRGWLAERDGTWQCTIDLDSLGTAVPESTRALISFRLDQLPPATRELLQAASIAGDVFTTQAVAAASERNCDEVEAELERLARAALYLQDGVDIEWPDGTSGRQHRFRHALYRQVLSTRITPTRRQLLHRRIAERLENGYRDRLQDAAGELSVHYEQAGDAFRAVDFIEMMVKQAYARCATHEAEALLAHAVALLKRTPNSPTRQQRLLQVTIAYGMALGAARGTSSVESHRAFEEARALGQSIPTSPEHIASLGSLAAGKLWTGHPREARSLGEQLLVLAAGDGSPKTAITAHVSIGTAHMYLGEIDSALEHLARAVALIDAEPPAAVSEISSLYDPAVPARMIYGINLLLSGKLETGWTVAQTAIAVARTIKMPWYLGYALTTAAAMAVFRRDPRAVRSLVTEALSHGEKNALPLWRDADRVALGWAAVMETRDRALIAPLREAVDAFRASGDSAVSRVCSVLADACLAVGDIDEAERALDDAFETRGEEVFYNAELVRLRGVLLLARNSRKRAKPAPLEQAEEYLERAVAIARTHGTHLFGLRASVDLCRLWFAAGKRKQARDHLANALAGFTEGFTEVDVCAASELLEQINRPGAKK